jgi:DNA-binding LacI/PurR family transcriptional regulator
MKRITIVDVAKKAGVSKGTVSAVINAKKTVKPATRDHILNLMKELNFRPKCHKNLKNGFQDKSIGIIIKDLSYPFALQLLDVKNMQQQRILCNSY